MSETRASRFLEPLRRSGARARRFMARPEEAAVSLERLHLLFVSTLGIGLHVSLSGQRPARRDLFAPRLHGRAQRVNSRRARHASENGVDVAALAAERSSSAPAVVASTSAGVRAPTSAGADRRMPSTQARAIWLQGTPRGLATSPRSRLDERGDSSGSCRRGRWAGRRPTPRLPASHWRDRKCGGGEGAGEKGRAPERP